MLLHMATTIKVDFKVLKNQRYKNKKFLYKYIGIFEKSSILRVLSLKNKKKYKH